MVAAVAKDTEKLIRQLSLISYLMAERRPVTATEIRRDVEGYSDMTEDAFARRFYADRAELDSLGIHLSVDRPADGFSEQENYSLAPEAFFLPAVEFTDAELAALQTALSLLDGEFAYAEPLRLALQQLTWGRPSPLGSPAQRAIGLGITGSAGGAELSARLAKVDTAIYRRKRIEFEYFTMQSGETALRKVDPYELLFEGGQFYLVGWSHERADDPRLPALAHPRQGRLRDQGRARLPAPRGLRPARLRQPHPVAARRPARHGRDLGVGPDRLARRAQLRPLRRADRRRRRRAACSARRTRSRGCCSRGRSATSSTRACSGPARAGRGAAPAPGPRRRAAPRRAVRVASSRAASPAPVQVEREPRRASARRRHPAGALRAPRHARLGPDPGRAAPASGSTPRRSASGCRCPSRSCARTSRCSTSSTSAAAPTCSTPRCSPNGEIEVDPEPYSDTFDRPARLLPIEARALLAAIELLGVHLSEDLVTVREKLELRARRHRQGGPARLQRAHATTRSRARSARRSRSAG